MNNDDAPIAVGDYHMAAAHRFPGLRNHRFRNAIRFAVWGVAGIIFTTVPTLRANPEHVLLYFLLLMAAVLLILVSMADMDLPWLERAAARLEGLLADMF